ncbi:ring finger protein 114 [Stylonychia lemnae]|uniref:Ring finger protein 114 n=1 Tax=Stylonychia lemnae TaxID=5949 RepID=A0A077ZUI8_STYLE|nr:ring finger protein 114 [Stylonychia lemnae]|eukprot:CDW73568.1 ring finger protein 114 [Stylonychia lemnae]
MQSIIQQNINDKNTCFICISVFSKAFKNKGCGHMYCGECIKKYIKVQFHALQDQKKIKCLLCESPLEFNDQIVEEEKLEQMEIDQDNQIQNVKVQDKPQILQQQQQQQPSQQVVQQQQQQQQPANKVFREKFDCTFCQQINFNHNDMLSHIQQRHYRQNGVCPICIERGGDKNFVSSNLLGHLHARHYDDPLYCPDQESYKQLLNQYFSN